ncbi:hypothetical protein HID58_037106 [Brassica napus]|uniref:Glycosyltransferase 61 catalytic domain-containing protein n=1 Tax=Brassica napus TaxID=3708 RepID=A0ABQ7XFX1_BRANA|nr:hypothetical protein HID58_037106 [Brassica napus]
MLLTEKLKDLFLMNRTICCDRTGFRSDICIMKETLEHTIHLHHLPLHILQNKSKPREKIKPYTRKWETSVMETVQELNLVYKDVNDEHHNNNNNVCDVVYHNVPAVFFSTGGYTETFTTSSRRNHPFHFNKRVVFVIVEYHILSQLSDHPPVDFNGDKRTHCFKEAIVRLKIHDELTCWIVLSGYLATYPRIDSRRRSREQDWFQTKTCDYVKNGSRVLLNENLLVKLAEEIGFFVEVLRPDKTTELAKIYRSLNSSDVMIGVHGAAMTHFFFLKPRTVFIQIIPLGTEWAAETYYGEPARS